MFSDIRVNENRVRIWAGVTNFRVSMLRVRLRLRAEIFGRTTLNHKSPNHVDGWMGNA